MNDSATVMIVDDDTDTSDSIASALEDRGYSVIAADNGHDALQKLRNNAALPSLILLDLTMPVMDGREFRAEQRSDPMLASIPVVLISANADVRLAAGAMDATAWLKKPVDLKALLKVVANTQGN